MALVVGAILVVAALAAFELIRASSGHSPVFGPAASTTAAPVSITGFVQAPYPPETLEFNTTSGKSYSAPVTETACASGGGGVCFVYFVSLPSETTYTVYAVLQGEGGNTQLCNAGSVAVTTLGSYNVDVSC